MISKCEHFGHTWIEQSDIWTCSRCSIIAGGLRPKQAEVQEVMDSLRVMEKDLKARVKQARKKPKVGTESAGPR